MSDNTETPIPPIVNAGDVNIHLAYIRRDLVIMKEQNAKDLQAIKDQNANDFKEIKEQLTAQANHYINSDEFEPVREAVQNKLVSKEEFDPIKRLVYGMVALMLTALVVAILATVVKQSP